MSELKRGGQIEITCCRCGCGHGDLAEPPADWHECEYVGPINDHDEDDMRWWNWIGFCDDCWHAEIGYPWEEEDDGPSETQQELFE